MKQLLTFVLFVLLSLSASAQKRIDYDYSKYFISDYVWIDYNQNEDIDKGEQYKTSGGNASCTVSFNYRDYGDYGNRIKIVMRVKNNGKATTFRANCEDIILLKLENGFGVYNKELDECWFSIIKMDGNVHALVFNPAIFEQ